MTGELVMRLLNWAFCGLIGWIVAGYIEWAVWKLSEKGYDR